MSLACPPLLVFVIGGPLGPASAGEFDRSTLPAAVAGPAQCDDFGGLNDSRGCKRISGYIAAGARFGSDQQIGGRPSPFGPLEAPEFVGSVRASGAAIIVAPSGQDRFFLPRGPDDETR